MTAGVTRRAGHGGHPGVRSRGVAGRGRRVRARPGPRAGAGHRRRRLHRRHLRAGGPPGGRLTRGCACSTRRTPDRGRRATPACVPPGTASSPTTTPTTSCCRTAWLARWPASSPTPARRRSCRWRRSSRWRARHPRPGSCGDSVTRIPRHCARSCSTGELALSVGGYAESISARGGHRAARPDARGRPPVHPPRRGGHRAAVPRQQPHGRRRPAGGDAAGRRPTSPGARPGEERPGG